MINAELLLFLIIFPFLIALLLMVMRSDKVREVIVLIGSSLIILASLWLLIVGFSQSNAQYSIGGEAVALLIIGAEIAITLYILYLGITFRQYAVIALAVIQVLLLALVEFTTPAGREITDNLFVDQFSVIMALIIGVIGSLICVYSLSYMREYHLQHADVRNRSSFFFFTMFLFLSAMFGLVFSNNLLWVLFFWEITTLCSFLLIGYSGTEEANKNAFWALLLNMAGGVAFLCGILYILYLLPESRSFSRTSCMPDPLP